MSVGLIGLGAMGHGVAQTLLANGISVSAYDVRREAVDAAVAMGAVDCHSLAEVANGVDTLIVFVVNQEQTEKVLFGPDGATSFMKPGAVVVVCATLQPSYMGEIGARLVSMGLDFIEAPVSGGVRGAAEGRLTLMTSGPDVAYEKCGRVLEAIANNVYRFGPEYGIASKVKIINQLLVGVQIAAAAEAVALGLREGVDPALLYEVITKSAGNSWAFADRVPRIVQGSYFPAQTTLDIFVKDLGLVLGLAGKTEFPLPLASAAYRMFEAAEDSGFGKHDDTAVIHIFPGINLPGKKVPNE